MIDRGMGKNNVLQLFLCQSFLCQNLLFFPIPLPLIPLPVPGCPSSPLFTAVILFVPLFRLDVCEGNIKRQKTRNSLGKESANYHEYCIQTTCRSPPPYGA